MAKSENLASRPLYSPIPGVATLANQTSITVVNMRRRLEREKEIWRAKSPCNCLLVRITELCERGTQSRRAQVGIGLY